MESFVICSRHLAADSTFFYLRDSCFFQLFFWRGCLSSYALLVRGCLKLFLGPSFFCVSYARFTFINGYCECLEHAHQFVRVNMAVSSCQVVLFCQVWL